MRCIDLDKAFIIVNLHVIIMCSGNFCVRNKMTVSLLCCVCVLCNYSKVQRSKSNNDQTEGSASKLMESGSNPNEQASNPERPVSNAENEEASGSLTKEPETDPPQATHCSNVQISDLVEEEAQDSVND